MNKASKPIRKALEKHQQLTKPYDIIEKRVGGKGWWQHLRSRAGLGRKLVEYRSLENGKHHYLMQLEKLRVIEVLNIF